MTWELHLGDCIDGMRAMADKSVDVVCADPPYSEHVHASAKTLGGIAQRGGNGDAGKLRCHGARKLELGFTHLTAADLDALAEQYARVSRRWVAVFSDTESAHLWREALERHGLEYVRTAFWHKLAGAPQFTGDRPAVALEAITICDHNESAVDAITLCHPRGRKRWNGGGKQGLYPYAIVQSSATQARMHPTQKPIALMRQILEDFTAPGDLILDSHAGSGTTGAACIELGRNFVGWELDPKHHETATRRLQEASKQQPLFRVATKQKQTKLAL